MDIILAKKIAEDWINHCAYTHELYFRIFLSNIPKSLLPHDKELITVAVNVLYEVEGETEYTTLLLKMTSQSLLFYKNDLEAMNTAMKLWENKELLKEMVNALQNSHEKLSDARLQQKSKN